MIVPTPGRWPVSRIQPGLRNRAIVIDDGIRELHQSILTNGLLQPLGVIDRPEDNLIYGFRRFTAMGQGGIETVPVNGLCRRHHSHADLRLQCHGESPKVGFDRT